ncbi:MULTISPECIES: rhomboid family intramembrane serine protease [Paraliobacillus]|uniref:rhomboid family intramembrane serine protease n=1 Tax=Paraliobacillus TaxID=200903 RepID=UPI000DD4E55A|nr:MULTISPECIES: rhomboid family intramembrane serine protease [Paraliobacillus]
MFFRSETFKDFIRFYPTVTIIIGIQLFVWLNTFFSTPLGDWIFSWGIGWNAAIEAEQYWRFLTPIFIHDPSSIMHILFNSFSLVLFGPALEQMLGKSKFIFVYLFAGVVGNIFTYLAEPGLNYMHYGASGAVYGLIGLYIYMAFSRKDLIDPSSRQIVITIGVIGLIMTFLRPGINIYAHLFGFIGGLALGPLVLTKAKTFTYQQIRRRKPKGDSVSFDPNRWNKKRFSPNKNVGAIIWGVIIVLIVLGVIGGLF